MAPQAHRGARPCYGEMETSSQQANLRVLAPHVSAHGGPGGHLGATQLAALCFHLVVGELNMFLQHVFRDVLLVAHRTGPLLAYFSHTEVG